MLLGGRFARGIALSFPGRGWHTLVPAWHAKHSPLRAGSWEVPALPFPPPPNTLQRKGRRMWFAVSGVDGKMFCIPLPRKSLWWQSSNRHQEKHLFSCWPLAQVQRLQLLWLSQAFEPEQSQWDPCWDQLLGSREWRTGQLGPSPCTAPLHGASSQEELFWLQEDAHCQLHVTSKCLAGSLAGWAGVKDNLPPSTHFYPTLTQKCWSPPACWHPPSCTMEGCTGPRVSGKGHLQP